jgi:hypothetical protein
VHLGEQAEVAKTYRELEARRETTQRLLWLVNKQEADACQSNHRRPPELELAGS